MKRKFAVLAFLLTCTVGMGAFAQNSLTIGNASFQGLTGGTVSVDMTSDNPVEGFVLAIAYDTTHISVMNVSVAGTVTEAAGAELIVPEIFEAQGGFTLGVVMDAQGPPFDGQTIPVPGGTIATFDVMPDVVIAAGDPAVVTPLTFSDGTFNNPPLDNIIVQGGFSIGSAQGLTLNNGSVTCEPAPPDDWSIGSVTVLGGATGCVPVTLNLSSGPLQGFVLAIGHDDAVVDLKSIDIAGTATEAVGAEFVVPNLNPGGGSGGTLGVVFDFDPPFAGQTIAPANGIVLANFCYCCDNPETFVFGDPVPPTQCSDITFEDGTLGTPMLSNVIVVAGLSLSPTQTNGMFCCDPVGMSPEDTVFYCGARDENNELAADPPKGAPGDIVELCFFYTEGTDSGSGCVGDNIQGFQMALTFDCNLCFLEGTFSIEGSILEAVGAEFVTVSVDNENDPMNDDVDDDCELTIGILLDALPPFERQTAPPSCTPLLVGCIDVEIKPTAPCEGDLPVTFQDFVDAGENVPIENIVVVGNQSIQGLDTVDCIICVRTDREFMRGDCNFDMKVDLADASSTLSQQFQGFPVPCLDSCDANDDGKLNLADTVFLLNYLFDSGPMPPDPGPDLDKGPDPTEDELTCENGENPCVP